MRKLFGAHTTLEERYRRNDAVLAEERERQASNHAKIAKLRAMREAREAGKLAKLRKGRK
ncbi:hypothetical protein SAMN05444161_8301 [Rhizobiales bacterium GAS191]|nr:hypothetical protein SAMN05444161_8301 [Rhizobiales bacterium GAS191]